LVVLFFGSGYCVAMTTHLDPPDHAPQPPMILTPQGWHDYRLLDSGHGRKLEEVGGYRFIRPEPQAFWAPHLPSQDWAEPAGVFVSGSRDQDEGGKWELSPSLPAEWSVNFEDIRFLAMPTPFRHFGFFPEQSRHWQWCADLIKARIKATGTRPLMLNLFGYTGVASLHAAKAGAEVTHVDSSKKAIAQGFANRDHAEMTDAPILLRMRAVLLRVNCVEGGAMMVLFLTPQNMGAGQKVRFGVSKMIWLICLRPLNLCFRISLFLWC
jgi:23S rRNA (cytosine1962-C5)-methyltransferase